MVDVESEDYKAGYDVGYDEGYNAGWDDGVGECDLEHVE